MANTHAPQTIDVLLVSAGSAETPAAATRILQDHLTAAGCTHLVVWAGDPPPDTLPAARAMIGVDLGHAGRPAMVEALLTQVAQAMPPEAMPPASFAVGKLSRALRGAEAVALARVPGVLGRLLQRPALARRGLGAMPAALVSSVSAIRETEAQATTTFALAPGDADGDRQRLLLQMVQAGAWDPTQAVGPVWHPPGMRTSPDASHRAAQGAVEVLTFVLEHASDAQLRAAGPFLSSLVAAVDDARWNPVRVADWLTTTHITPNALAGDHCRDDLPWHPRELRLDWEAQPGPRLALALAQRVDALPPAPASLRTLGHAARAYADHWRARAAPVLRALCDAVTADPGSSETNRVLTQVSLMGLCAHWRSPGLAAHPAFWAPETLGALPDLLQIWTVLAGQGSAASSTGLLLVHLAVLQQSGEGILMALAERRDLSHPLLWRVAASAMARDEVRTDADGERWAALVARAPSKTLLREILDDTLRARPAWTASMAAAIATYHRQGGATLVWDEALPALPIAIEVHAALEASAASLSRRAARLANRSGPEHLLRLLRQRQGLSALHGVPFPDLTQWQAWLAGDPAHARVRRAP